MLKNSKKGFTLLELLVVVLIIGVLAAIALPQYKRAIAKARAAEAITILKSITDAQERYATVNNSYTNDLDELDIEVNSDGKYFTFECKENRTCQASPKVNGYPVFEFHMKQKYTTTQDIYLGKHWCFVQRLVKNGASVQEIENARNICLMFGPLDSDMVRGYHYLVK